MGEGRAGTGTRTGPDEERSGAGAGGSGEKSGGARHEEHRVRGERLVETVKKLIHEGNVRRIIIKNEDGRTLIEVPLSLGVVGTVLVPVWAAIGAIAALVANCSIVVVREEELRGGEDEGGSGAGA